MNSKVKESIENTIQSISEELREISLKIHTNPELGHQETNAYQLLTNYLLKKGFKITLGAAGLDTAFLAEFSNNPSARRIGFCSEYDALPGIGHGCGHNLIAIQGLACALSLKALLEQDLVQGTVVLFGTPAEETTGGKVPFVEQGIVQSKVDCAMMLHPLPLDALYMKMLALDSVHVEFFGKASHAGQAPWEGINALDALMQGFDNIALLRQQTLPTNRIHGIIKNGGDSPNVIPAYASGLFYARSIKKQELVELKTHLENCLRAAALATGCQVKMTWAGAVDDVVNNSPLMALFQHTMEHAGVTYPPRSEQEKQVAGSTDMGNFSYAVPAIHACYGLHIDAPNHTREFADAAKTLTSHRYTLRAAHSLALTAAHTLLDEALYKRILSDFEKNT
ncbi:hypothetical protein BY458DRAFT_525552 [Sporodiniella umbellata]|nr:hypothetical protein BY458DRAFT_525552 [Sporodiniella umbellata]